MTFRFFGGSGGPSMLGLASMLIPMLRLALYSSMSVIVGLASICIAMLNSWPRTPESTTLGRASKFIPMLRCDIFVVSVIFGTA